ncbi:MAG: alpha/beta hydrolase [Verrucomicrobiota bacterium]
MLAIRALFVGLLLICATTGICQSVHTVSWQSTAAAPLAALPEEQQRLLPLLRLGASTVSEASLLPLLIAGSTSATLPPDEVQQLQKLVTHRYQLIEKGSTFTNAASSLAYCFSDKRPSLGQASVYFPEDFTSETPAIVFLHGFGGSFIFYLHFLAETFPDHLIICPAHGMSSSDISSTYLTECQRAISEKWGNTIDRPLLIGLSAGGFGAFREYARRPDNYSGLICLAAYPPIESRIRLLVGENEPFVKAAHFGSSIQYLEQRCSDFKMQMMPDSDHFFLLKKSIETQNALRQFQQEFSRR